MDRRDKGFTLLETLVVMAGGLVLLAITMGLFTTGMKSALFATERAEMQQNIRAALNAITHDLSMAGSRIPNGGITLGPDAMYGCDATSCKKHYFPTFSSKPILYGVMPDPSPAGNLNQIITIAYVDTNLATCDVAGYTPSGSQIELGACVTTDVPGQYKYNDPGYGLNEGDLMLLSAPTLSESVIGVITNVNKQNGKVEFADSDKFDINKASAKNGNIASFLTAAEGVKPAKAAITASRLLLITYYMQRVNNGPDGVEDTADDSYRLMRQVNAQAPVPVAENISSLQFTYDVLSGEDSTTIVANRANANGTPSLIRKVNIAIQAMSAPRKPLVKMQYLRLATSIEPRNLVYRDLYEFQKEQKK